VSRILGSIRLRLGIILVFLSALVVLSAITGLNVITVRNGGEELFNVATAQSAQAYQLAVLANSLANAQTDAERTNISKLLSTGVDTFDANQKLFRDEDLSRGTVQTSNTEAFNALDRADKQWANYRDLLLRYLESIDTALLPRINTQATAVFVYTSEFSEAVDLLINAAFEAASRTFVVLLIATVISLGISLVLLVQIARSLNRLTTAAQAYAHGRYETRVDVRTLSEVAQVGRVLNNMADAVAIREADLKDLNQALEKRVQDRTEDLRKARDEALTASRLAQQSARLKGEFLSTMSHELRTPLNAIEGFTSIMLSNMGIDLNPRAKTMVERISANSKRLLGLINDFLDLSRIESGRLDLVKSPVVVDSLVQRWVSQVNVLAEQKQLMFNAELDPQMPTVMLGDEEALTKIVINLLSNAFKFTHNGAIRLHISPQVEGQYAIEVHDSGIGIPPHAREYIFEEFRQVDGSSKRKYGGTGLGLAIVQKLARAMGGTVTLQSELGIGSTFTVTLPLEKAIVSEGISL
jgi:signal transduction histidine kinase